MVKTHVEESLGANPGDAALNPADPVAMGVPDTIAPGFLGSSRGRAFRALAHPSYRLLFTAFLVNQTGFWISHMGLQGLMVELSHNQPIWLGLLFFALFIPAFALAPLAGIAADRFDRKRIMLASYGAVAALIGDARGVHGGSVGSRRRSCSCSALGLGTSFAFAGPASFALAANAVPDERHAERRVAAVGRQQPHARGGAGRRGAVRREQPLRVGVRVLRDRRTRLGGADRADARRPLRSRSPRTAASSRGSRSGFAHARERRPALPALAMVGTLSLFGVSHSAILPVFAEQVLGSAHYFTWIVVATGAGAMLGALSIGYRSQGTSMQGAALLMIGYSAAMAAFAFTRVLPYALVAQFVIGWTYFARDDEPPDADPVDRRRVEARPRDEPVPGRAGRG